MRDVSTTERAVQAKPMNIILYAVPGFFLLIVIELIAEKIKGTDYYRLNDTITSLTTGVLSELMKVVSLLIPFTAYVTVYQNFAFFRLSDSALVWVVAFVLYDFCYYWKHRFGHEMNLMWAAHVVHHSSEEYNLSTALRQTGGSNIGFIFFLPLALIGFDPLMVVTVGALNLIYQYWVHTQHIGTLGWLEWMFVTPSNHRVHHAQNGIYIDRNYGGVFILWDRLFGSFQQELDEEPPIFGIRGAVKSWNPIWVNLQVYSQLLQDCMHTRNWWHKLTVWFRRTGWRPADVIDRYPLLKTDLNHFQKFDTTLSLQAKAVAVIAYVLNVGVALFLLLNLHQIVAWQQIAVIAYLLVSSFSVGALLEKRRFALVLEGVKNGIFVTLCVLLLPLKPLLLVAISSALLSIVLLILMSRDSASAQSQSARQ